MPTICADSPVVYCESCGAICTVRVETVGYNTVSGVAREQAWATCPNRRWWHVFKHAMPEPFRILSRRPEPPGGDAA